MPEILQLDESNDPYLRLPIAGAGEMIATPANSALFLHDKAYAGLDHLFVYGGLPNADASFSAIILWRRVLQGVGIEFDELVGELLDYCYPCVRAEQPTQQDATVFETSVLNEFELSVDDKTISAFLDEQHE